MKNCFRKISLPSVSIIFAVALALGSCTKVDDSLGSGLIPLRQQTSVGMATFGETPAQYIRTYMNFTDSVYSKDIGAGFIGKLTDSKFGKVYAASIFEFMPTITKVDTTSYGGFGYEPEIDSVRLQLYMTAIGGDKDKVQDFLVYQLKDTLATSSDSSYYASFEYENHIHPDPLFSFSFSGEPRNPIADTIKLTTTANGDQFLKDLLAETSYYEQDENYKYTNQDAFREMFKGLVIAPADNSPQDATLYRFILGSSGMTVHFHNKDPESPHALKDSIVMVYHFDDDYLQTNVNHSVASMRRDYSGTEFAEVKDGEIGPFEVSYIEGLAGMTAVLEFPEALFDAIRALKPDDSYDLMINQAQMFIMLEDQTTEGFDFAFERMGSYYDYAKLVNIPDYYYMDELNLLTIPYGGYLNRTHGYYMMDISSYVHHAVHSEDISRRFTLGPIATVSTSPFFYRLSGIRSGIEGNEDSQPIKIKITYTLIK